jgi:hypothetical protein
MKISASILPLGYRKPVFSDVLAFGPSGTEHQPARRPRSCVEPPYLFPRGGNFSNIFFIMSSITFAFLSDLLLIILVAVPRQIYLLVDESPISTIADEGM